MLDLTQEENIFMELQLRDQTTLGPGRGLVKS